MINITEKLYPPVIDGTLPAFYSDSTENGTVTKITVPFSMNKGVNTANIGGFSLKLKTIQSNNVVAILPSQSESTLSISNRQVTFLLTDTSKIHVGQFLKAQLAYTDKEGVVGYYSTVGIIKYTDKPTVYIEKLGLNSDQQRPFQSSYTGVYKTGEDKTERPYSYNFSLYDRYNELVESSGWLLHNTTLNNIASESLSLDVTTDSYVFKTQLITDEEYYLQYTVRTINNIEISSPLYICVEPLIGPPTFLVNLNAENVFDDGYINLSFSLNDHYFFNTTPEELIEKYRINNNPVDAREYPNTNKIGEIHVLNDDNNTEFIIKITYNKSGDEGTIPVKYEILDPVSKETRETFYQIQDSSVSVEICRAEKTDNFQTWKVLQKVYLSGYNYAINKWSFKDFTIEQGITYKYCFRQYNKDNVHSDRAFSNLVMADFEDMFLWDGKKQLKIRFNPQVSSFKTTYLEQKTDTIGSRYPFIFKNGQVAYKEFPLNGLISYLMDDHEFFVDHKEDLNILLGSQSSRKRGTPVNQSIDDNDMGKSWEISQTQNSVGYNMQAERRFKLKLLDWLNDGNIKMFKSPAEGNYLVRLLNVSLAPENGLSRMIHSFSCTAYEVEEYNYNNLVDLGFVTNIDTTQLNLAMKTISFREVLTNAFEGISNSNINLSYAIKLNTAPIFEYARIDKSSNPANESVYVRYGINEVAKTEINEPTYIWEVRNKNLSDIYLCPNDYAHLFSVSSTKAEKIQTIIDTIGNTQITYYYYETEECIGDFYNLQDIYLQNIVETIVGPITRTFTPSSAITENGTGQEIEVTKFFTVNFQPKAERKLILRDNTYIDFDTEQTVSYFDKLSVYRVYNDNNEQIHILYLNSNDSITITNDENPNTTVTLIATNNNDETETYNLKDLPPNVNLGQRFYKSITLSYGAYLECAYQQKVITYNDTIE